MVQCGKLSTTRPEKEPPFDQHPTTAKQDKTELSEHDKNTFYLPRQYPQKPRKSRHINVFHFSDGAYAPQLHHLRKSIDVA